MDSKYIVADLDAVESFGGEKPEDGAWKPLRAKLGIEAFGINAFEGREVGARTIEDHSEVGGGTRSSASCLPAKCGSSSQAGQPGSLVPRISSLSARARSCTSRLRFSSSVDGGSLGS